MPKFLVIQKQADMPIPMDLMKKVLPAQLSYLQALGKSGKMEIQYGFAGAKGGMGILNVASHEELQEIASRGPMWPFIEREIHPLITLEETQKTAMEMLSKIP